MGMVVNGSLGRYQSCPSSSPSLACSTSLPFSLGVSFYDFLRTGLLVVKVPQSQNRIISYIYIYIPFMLWQAFSPHQANKRPCPSSQLCHIACSCLLPAPSPVPAGRSSLPYLIRCSFMGHASLLLWRCFFGAVSNLFWLHCHLALQFVHLLHIVAQLFVEGRASFAIPQSHRLIIEQKQTSPQATCKPRYAHTFSGLLKNMKHT